jgi:uncharacterized protein (DUF2336 family)
MKNIQKLATLLEDVDPIAREKTAKSLAQLWHNYPLSQEEKEAVALLLKVAALDMVATVRAELAKELAPCPILPIDIARILAFDTDEEQVSIPWLTFGVAIDDEILKDVLCLGKAEIQQAIARRAIVSQEISTLLAATGNALTVNVLAKNPGASLEEPALTTILDRFPYHDAIHESLVYRPILPPIFAERLLSSVADSLKEQLLLQHRFPPDTVRRVVTKALERSTLSVIRPHLGREDVKRMVRHLHDAQKLTDDIIARSSCTGDMIFLEEALALRASLPNVNVRTLLLEGGEKSIERLCIKAKIDTFFIPILEKTLMAWITSPYFGQDALRVKGMRLLLERLTTTDAVDTDGHIAWMVRLITKETEES